jgi:hypothetical protein
MATYCIILTDEVVSLVEDADAYCLEGPLTTYFRTRNGSAVIDSWSERLASFRTASIASVQRLGDASEPAVRSADEAAARGVVSIVGAA